MIDDAARRPSVEWPTVALAAAIYVGWLMLTYLHAAMPVWVLVPVGAWLVCWHSSLQHEILHGHPTRSIRINRLIALPPLALWLPFDRYRETHLTHHNDERLTDPLDDPESRYLIHDDWVRLGPMRQRLVRAQSTLLGRLLIGPFWAVGLFLRSEFWAIIDDAPGRRLLWLKHMVAVTVVLMWLILVADMSLWLYILGFVLPGTSLMLIRSFAEHRAHASQARRTAVVEAYGPLAVLFLFNNLHAAHHARPRLAWYQLPRFYRNNREAFIGPEAGPFYKGYRDVFRRFLMRAHDQPVHPLGRIPARPRSLTPGV